MAPRKRTGLVQVKLRISDDLKRRLDREAMKREDGSLSAEIAERLELSFTGPTLEKAIATAAATAVVNKLKTVEWQVPTGKAKKGGEQ
jgi:predicted transcriptional regulator